jgi:hypothetical protein
MVNPEFIIIKPSNWKTLMFFEKIKYYGVCLNQHYSKYVDKINAKGIVQEICGENVKVAKILKILKHPHDICLNELADECIIKSSHGSSWNIPIKKRNINYTNMLEIRKKLNSWNRVYSTNEKQYMFIKPRFFIEETIDDKYYGKTGNALVYMVRCIHGKAITISPYLKNEKKISNYDINWNLICKNELPHIEKPKNIEKMINCAELLSKPFEFVRIDFYIDKNDDLYFSEYTFTPNAGEMVFTKELEKILANSWI